MFCLAIACYTSSATDYRSDLCMFCNEWEHIMFLLSSFVQAKVLGRFSTALPSANSNLMHGIINIPLEGLHHTILDLRRFRTHG